MPITGVPATIAAIYTTVAGQSIANNTLTIVDFDTKVRDTHNAVTTGAVWKFTAPASGFYQVSAVIEFAATTLWEDTEAGRLHLYVNGVSLTQLDRKDNYGSTSSIRMQLGGAMLVYLTAGDDLSVLVNQNSDAALALSSYATNNYVSVVKFAGS